MYKSLDWSYARQGQPTDFRVNACVWSLQPQVPCLIKELLEKHFNSPEAIHKFLMTPVSHSAAAQADSQSHAPKTVEDTNDWLMKSDTVSRKGTAFIPFKQGVPQAGNEDSVPVQRESSHSPPFSVDDISNAIYKNISARYTTRPQPLHTQTQQQPLLQQPLSH